MLAIETSGQEAANFIHHVIKFIQHRSVQMSDKKAIDILKNGFNQLICDFGLSDEFVNT